MKKIEERWCGKCEEYVKTEDRCLKCGSETLDAKEARMEGLGDYFERQMKGFKYRTSLSHARLFKRRLMAPKQNVRNMME